MKAKIALVVVCVVVCALALCACFPAYDLNDLDVAKAQSARYIAHRGLNALGDVTLPANTVQSFRAAAASTGVWGIETDVWQTRDGVLVCMHDADAVKGVKDVTAATWDEVRSTPLKDYKDGNYYAPTFEEYLSIVREGGKVAVVEIKDKSLSEETMDEMLSTARRMGVSVTVISFYLPKLLYLRAQDPSLPCMWLVDKGWRRYQRALPEGDGSATLPELVDECLTAGIFLSSEYTFLDAHEKEGDGWIAAFHRAGLSVGVWTIDSLETALYFTGVLGVDYITSNTDMGTLASDYLAHLAPA